MKGLPYPLLEKYEILLEGFFVKIKVLSKSSVYPTIQGILNFLCMFLFVLIPSSCPHLCKL